MSSWLSALGADLEAPAGAPPSTKDASLDLLLDNPAREASSRPATVEEEVSLEAMLFPSEPPPKA